MIPQYCKLNYNGHFVNRPFQDENCTQVANCSLVVWFTCSSSYFTNEQARAKSDRSGQKKMPDTKVVEHTINAG